MIFAYSALLHDGRNIEFHAESDKEARDIASRLDPLKEPVSVKQLLPLVDWGRGVLNVHELATLLGCSTAKVYALVQAKQLPFSKPTPNGLFFRRESLDRLLASTETVPDAMQDRAPKVLKFKSPNAA